MDDALVNLNNAGAARPAARGLGQQVEHLEAEVRLGGYEAAVRAADRLSATYAALRRLVNAQEGEMAFMDSATRGWNVFLYSLDLPRGSTIVTSRAEFGTNLVSLTHLARRRDCKLSLVRVGPSGMVDLEDLANKLTPEVSLVALSHIVAHRGAENDAEAIGALVKAQGRALFLLDVCQSAGQIPIDVQRFGCNAASGTGRKWLRGPRGTGFLYVRADIANATDPLTVDLSTALLGTDIESSPSVSVIAGTKRFETSERSIAGVLGLGGALQEIESIGIDAISRQVSQHSRRLRQGLRSLGMVSLEPLDSRVGIVGLAVEEDVATSIKDSCTAAGLAISIMRAYDAPIDYRDLNATTVVRISPHYYNVEEEIQRCLEAVERAI